MRTLSIVWVAWVVVASIGCATTQPNGPTTPVSPGVAKLAQNPADAEATFAQAESAEADGDLLRAEQYYVRAERLGIDPARTLPRVLAVLVSSERLGDALMRCQKYLEDKPDDVRVRYLLALIEIALEHPRDAATELRMVIAQKPEVAQPYLLLGRLYRDRLSDVRSARDMFHRYLALAPDTREATHLRLELAAERMTAEKRR